MGLDIGSTTVKAVLPGHDGDVLWHGYRRHGGRQLEAAAALLELLAREGAAAGPVRVGVTGSGGGQAARQLEAPHLQELSALALAVQRRFPRAATVMELGGHDAKMIFYQQDEGSGARRRVCTMNDKCAGSTGVVLDSVARRLDVSPARLAAIRYRPEAVHPVAAKCGVFAETDLVGLHRRGVGADSLLISLFEAVVCQNLGVLARANTPLPPVLLTGGPNAMIPGLAQCWRHHLRRLWSERGVDAPQEAPDVLVPEHALYLCAMGAALAASGKGAGEQAGSMRLEEVIEKLEELAARGRDARDRSTSLPGFFADEAARRRFVERTSPAGPSRAQAGADGPLFIGLDAGSTSTKCAALAADGALLATSYRLGGDNPVQSSRRCLEQIRRALEEAGRPAEPARLGVTGYAKDYVGRVVGADVTVVETVAHARSATHFVPGADVVCDVGGQDIKIIQLRGGRITDFKLNGQCSAGTGAFLHSTAAALGFSLEEAVDAALAATSMPAFQMGCTLFLQADIVDFQQKGWSPEQILAGLARVLPQNIWYNVAGPGNLAALGSSFVLQGGTQLNGAALKAQIDFIQQTLCTTHRQPLVELHPHPAEAGAIGAALLAREADHGAEASSFVGFEALGALTWRDRTDESTRCGFCANRCGRTVVEVMVEAEAGGTPRQVVVGNRCEAGAVLDRQQARARQQARRAASRRCPNLVARQAERAFAPHQISAQKDRSFCRIAMPRALGMYSLAPLFTAYFQALGVPRQNLLWSGFSSPRLFKEGSSRGTVDPCYPAKLAAAHVHALLRLHRDTPFDVLFFPAVNDYPPGLTHAQGSKACPTLTAMPEVVRASFTKEEDLFVQSSITPVFPWLCPAAPGLLARQLYRAFADVLRLDRRENDRAVGRAYEAYREGERQLRREGEEALDALEEQGRVGVVVLGRPYHGDPGQHHGIPEAIRRMGYPVFCPESLPTDEPRLKRLFDREVEQGVVAGYLDISDVWKNTYSEQTNRKLWAAKYAARHPNLVAVELSSFKCGMDAPVYAVVERILAAANTPFFRFLNLDENRGEGALRVRLETLEHLLGSHRVEARR